MHQFKKIQSITDRSNDSLKMFLFDISKYPLLSIDEEVDLAYKIHQGDKKALNKLINSNLRFVVTVAKQYQNQGLDLMDLISEGSVGLARAAKKFDETKGFKFISYAVWWIRQSIMQALSEYSRTIRLPNSKASGISKIAKTISKFEQENERIPSDEELSELLGEDLDKISAIMTSNHGTVSVDTAFNVDDSDSGCLLDVLANKDIPETDVSLGIEDTNTILSELLDNFDDRDSDILKMSFGLQGIQPLTYEDIGKRFGLTGERIRQLHNAALRKIKNEYSDLAKELI